MGPKSPVGAPQGPRTFICKFRYFMLPDRKIGTAMDHCKMFQIMPAAYFSGTDHFVNVSFEIFLSYVRFREAANKAMKKHFKDNLSDERVEFFPVEWRSSLKLDEGLLTILTISTNISKYLIQLDLLLISYIPQNWEVVV